MSINEIQQAMDEFVRMKGWYDNSSNKPQTAINMAKSICIESAELLECFQWQNNPPKHAVADELADVILYAAQLANVYDMDLSEAIADKIARNHNRDWQ